MDNDEEKTIKEDTVVDDDAKTETAVTDSEQVEETKTEEKSVYDEKYSDIVALAEEAGARIGQLQEEVGLIKDSIKNGITSAITLDVNRTIKEQLAGVKEQGEIIRQQQQLLNELQSKIEENKRVKSEVEPVTKVADELAGEEK